MIELGRRDGRLVRIGHRGAAALAPENTLESLRAAVELGVDLVEFDVLDQPDGALVLAHSPRELPPDAPTLDDALAFFTRDAVGTGLHLDLKPRGHERALVEALRRHRLVARTFVSSFDAAALRELAALEPALRLGLTYPWDRRGLAGHRPLAPLVAATLLALRRALPRRIETLARRAAASVAVLHWAVVSRAAVARCHGVGVPVIAWTVNDPKLLARLDSLGVDGVVTDDPRIFDG